MTPVRHCLCDVSDKFVHEVVLLGSYMGWLQNLHVKHSNFWLQGGASWTKDWLGFSNDYFLEVKASTDPDLLVLDTDACLFTDEAFK